MRTISVASRKGGQGKSFLTRAIAVLALMEGKTADYLGSLPQGRPGQKLPHPRDSRARADGGENRGHYRR
jgi:hypothetical protein